MHLFNKCVLCSCYVPDLDLDTGDITMQKNRNKDYIILVSSFLTRMSRQKTDKQTYNTPGTGYKKIKQSKNMESWISIIISITRKGFPKKVTFEKKTQKKRVVFLVDTWRKDSPDRGSVFKGLEVGPCLALPQKKVGFVVEAK